MVDKNDIMKLKYGNRGFSGHNNQNNTPNNSNKSQVNKKKLLTTLNNVKKYNIKLRLSSYTFEAMNQALTQINDKLSKFLYCYISDVSLPKKNKKFTIKRCHFIYKESKNKVCETIFNKLYSITTTESDKDKVIKEIKAIKLSPYLNIKKFSIIKA